MLTIKQIKEKLPYFGSYNIKDGIIMVREGFFYTLGKSADTYVNIVKRSFPDANIIDSGEVWKPFRCGASVANQSHWYVKFSVPDHE